MDRRTLLARLAGLAVAPWPLAEAATPRGARRIAVLLFDRREAWDWFEADLRAELAAFGWIEGKNLRLDWHYADSDLARLRSLAAQIVASRPDVIVARGTPATRVLHEATRTIPIATGLGDPIGGGFAKTYAQPGGNVTGLSFAIVETCEKYVEFLRLLVPGLAHLVVVSQADRGPFQRELVRPVEAAARAGGVTVRPVLVADLGRLQEVLRIDPARGPTAALVFNLGVEVGVSFEAVAAVTLASRMPSMFEHRAFVDAGGLASYRMNWEQQTRRSAAQVNKLLRGEPPGRIPFELPTRQEFVLNLKTARALGLKLPQALLLRADAIVE